MYDALYLIVSDERGDPVSSKGEPLSDSSVV